MKDMVAIARTREDLGTPTCYSSHELDIVKGMLAECLDPLGGIRSVARPGSKIVIKVNAGFCGPPGVYTTDPRVVEALVILLREEVELEEIIIAENAANFHMLEEINVGATTMECFEACGLSRVAERHHVRLLALEHDVHEQVMIPDARVMTHCLVPRTILNADTLIFVPHLKTHIACGVTLSIKLNQGVIPTSEKKRFHDARLTEKLLDLLGIIRPHLSIIDGLWAMQGQGPTSPFPEDIIEDMNVLVAGRNPMAVDAVGTMLMGFDPKDIPVLAKAEQEGLVGYDTDSISLVGSPLEICARKFRAPDMRLKGVYPNVLVYQGEACEGCISHLRIYLDQLLATGILDELTHPLTIILGRNGPVPEMNNGPVLVVGDCTAEHRNRGLFVTGCCPLAHIFQGLLDQVSLCCDLEKFRFTPLESAVRKHEL